jgi:diaminopimelate decarboxylase
MSDPFLYRDQVLCAGEVPVPRLVSELGTPLYVYSADGIRDRYRRFCGLFGPLVQRVYFAVKACSNLSILAVLRELGAGFEVVSPGEIERCLRAGSRPGDLVFAGLGKTRREMRFALGRGLGLFHVDSREELFELEEECSRAGRRASFLLRINPDVDAATHEHTKTGRRQDKFGVEPDVALRAIHDFSRLEFLGFRGFHVHIGSQIQEVGPFLETARRMVTLVDAVRSEGGEVETLNLGGGFGVDFGGSEVDVGEIARGLGPLLEGRALSLCLEPGRYLVANQGVLVGRVLRVKSVGGNPLVITDVGMNDFLRPALYQAEHPIRPVRRAAPDAEIRPVDVVGPVCESADTLARGVDLPLPTPGDLLAVFGAGAYGFSMSSNYNSRLRAAEVLVDGSRFRCIRRRETLEDLLAAELPDVGPPEPISTAATQGRARPCP